MAVQVLPGSHTRILHHNATLNPLVLALALVPSALDMLRAVQPTLPLTTVCEAAGALAALVLLTIWLRFPRTSWLAAAGLAAGASVMLRAFGDPQPAPLFALLSVLALGIGGAFESTEGAWFSPERV